MTTNNRQQRLRRVEDEYEEEHCPHCGQDITYILPVDRGAVEILIAISVAIRNKGINCIHPRKEMEIISNDYDLERILEEGKLTSNQINNLTRLRAHGLIAHHQTEKGNWVLTTKGIDFLNGKEIPRFAIMNKAKGIQDGYWMEEKYSCVIQNFLAAEDYWEGINYVIEGGRVIVDAPQKSLL